MLRFISPTLTLPLTRATSTSTPSITLPTLESVVHYAREKGFVSAAADAHGGFRGGYTYLPLGTRLKANLVSAWWKAFVHSRRDMHPVDSPILTPPSVLAATGHLESFGDPVAACVACGKPVRADSPGACGACGKKHGVVEGGEVFNLLFETRAGAGEGREMLLRPETAQGMFTAVNEVVRAMRISRLPFGTACVGKAFRNEISPRDFLFRVREFEQGEIEWFAHKDDADQWFVHWVEAAETWLGGMLNHPDHLLRLVPHPGDDLAHYARATTDIEFKYPFGWGELWGVADRGSFDLDAHAAATSSKIPALLEDAVVIEPSLGFDRLVFAVLVDAMATTEDSRPGVLALAPSIAPIKATVLPLVAKDAELVAKAVALARGLGPIIGDVTLETSGSIGKRYRRADSLGVPVCITVDSDSLDAGSGTFTVRNRDTKEQKKLGVDDLIPYLMDALSPPASLPTS